ncbi:MAG TPA: hypothetical protein VG929_07130 [Actinomycetota bacterium]|nr:hypothetical protein [Actinomycetota bacterium]
MKRVIVALLALSLVAALAPLGAQAAPGPQKYEGNVMLPGPGPNGAVTEGCWTGWPRRFWIFSQGTTAGPFGDIFEIDKTTWGGKFKLEVTGGGAGTEDLDMTFYADPGKVDPADPAQQGGIMETGSYLTREPGGEEGTVPPTSTLVLVCLGVGTGYDADFTYTAAPPKKKKR